MRFNNILTAVIVLVFSALLVIGLSTGHNKKVVEYAQEGPYYHVVIAEGTDTTAIDYMSHADFEHLTRTGSLR